MAEVELKMTQLVNLAIGNPEIGAVNFNLLQRVLMEMLKLSDLDSATVTINAEDAAKLEETYTIKPTAPAEEPLGGVPITSSIRKSGHQCPIDAEKVDRLLEDMNQVKFDLEDLTTKLGNMAATTETVPFQELHTSISNIDELNEKVNNLEVQMELLKDLDLGEGDDRTVGQRLIYIEKHVNDHSEQLEKINNILDDKLKNIIARFATMEKDMGVINEKLNIAESSSQLHKQPSRGDLHVTSAVLDQSSTINNLVSRLSTLQQDLDKLTVQMTSVNDEQEQRQMVIDVMNEQIDLLKMVKADKINVEDVLAAKADLSQVHRKVSHDHFETKMIKLDELLDDAFNRLDAHEEMWQEEVECLKTDIESKLDRAEFSPMKDYINERLKLLQDKMKTLMNRNRGGTAAGTKKRLIRDVQCISCDNDSVMKPEINFDDMTPPPSLPVHQSVKPYLTYELDKVRKQQKRLPGKNMLHFEEMMKEGKDLKQVSSKQSRNPDNVQALEKLTKEGRDAFAKGFTIVQHGFGTPDQPNSHIDISIKQGKDAYLKGAQLFAKAARIPGMSMHNVQKMLQECRDAYAKGHEQASRFPNHIIMNFDEMMKEGQNLFDIFLSAPGFNLQFFEEKMEHFRRSYERNQKMMEHNAMKSQENLPNVEKAISNIYRELEKGSALRNVNSHASSPRSTGDQLVNRYVGGSHTKTTAQQRISRTGNFYETWGPIITAVNPPEQSKA